MVESKDDYFDSRVLEHLHNSASVKEIKKEEKVFVEDKTAKVAPAKSSDDEVIQIRKEKIINFFKNNYDWVSYLVLGIIVYMSVKIRSSNLGGLRDITTGTWTLGPDLDPFFFLRMMEYIIANGKLVAIDMMRYVPFGFNMENEYILHPYLMAWFHKVAVYFGSESVIHSAVIYPVFMFALTVVAFFLMTRKIFIVSMGAKKANVIALIASFLLSVMPPLLPRTIAGIPEKEASGFLFLFLAFYFFLSAWQSDHKHKKYIFALLAGLSTTAMSLIWGGFSFIFYALAPTVFIAFLLGKIGKDETIVYTIWVASSLILMNFFSPTRYLIMALLTSVTTGSVIIILLIIFVHQLLFKSALKKNFESRKLAKIPPRVISIVVTLVVLIVLVTAIFGLSFIPSRLNGVISGLVKPAQSRLIQTVAENRQPYFTEWANSFGPHVRNLPLTFWLFFFGSIYLFFDMIKAVKTNERFILTTSYIVFLIAIIFSRYSGGSKLNGENFTSLSFYALGFLVFVGTVGYYYYQYYKRDNLDHLKNINIGMVFIFSFFFLGIIAARAAVRVIMVLVPPVSIIIAYFVVASYAKARKSREDLWKIFAWGVFVLVILATFTAGHSFYQAVKGQAPAHVPSIYTQQWQKAMFWVRENTPEDAVFGHWWDYGYWLQSIGERATVLDGGNAISYWNHLMGRHGLTGTDDKDALEFLYAHNTTHFLIDSTDIGKYGAFSSIGSDVNYDRASYIPTFSRNNQATQEAKNSTIYVYQGGVGVDEDIIYENNGTKVFLPAGSAGIAGVIIEKDKSGKIVKQPEGVFFYQNIQYNLPLRYAYDKEFMDYGKGVEVGFYLFPNVVQGGAGLNIEEDGVLLYLSKRTVKSQLARLYLYKEDNPYFELVHSEDDFLVGQFKAQYPNFGYDIVNYQGLRGPIRIWEIHYPEDIEFKEEYLSTLYPEEIAIAK